ncbi:MAG: MTH1187 family thiamine-binding protein [Candidatus Omnitrophica bacterium]|nr:MTH1187 family thiamine-binding protein [Candidatus Omnitrophota bacterium]
MLAELELVPIGTKSASLSALLAEVVRRIDESGLDYRVGPMGTVIEGDWDAVMRVAKSCHEALLASVERVMTTIRIDDRTDRPAPGRIAAKVQSLEARLGRSLKR